MAVRIVLGRVRNDEGSAEIIGEIGSVGQTSGVIDGVTRLAYPCRLTVGDVKLGIDNDIVFPLTVGNVTGDTTLTIRNRAIHVTDSEGNTFNCSRGWHPGSTDLTLNPGASTRVFITCVSQSSIEAYGEELAIDVSYSYSGVYPNYFVFRDGGVGFIGVRLK